MTPHVATSPRTHRADIVIPPGLSAGTTDAPALSRLLRCLALLMLLAASLVAPQAATAQAQPAGASHLARLLPDLAPADIVPGADAFGPVREDLPVAPVMGGETVGWAFVTSDFVGTTGYSGKPIHTGRGGPGRACDRGKAGQALRTHRPDRHPAGQDRRSGCGLYRP